MSSAGILPVGVTIRRSSLTDGVYESLLEAIVTGRLAPGSELNAVTLARELDVSRTPVTEALRRLEHDGLVEHVTNRKSRVARFTRRDVIELYEVRKHLEAASAELAANQISDEVLKQLGHDMDALAEERRAIDWGRKAIAFDIRFHDLLAEATGNRRLREDIARYRLLVRSFCRLTGRETNLEQAFAEHRSILEALQARDSRRAREAMLSHIERRLDAVLRDLFAAPA
jgi:DNA-binding GntR family transcriptional regulator